MYGNKEHQLTIQRKRKRDQSETEQDDDNEILESCAKTVLSSSDGKVQRKCDEHSNASTFVYEGHAKKSKKEGDADSAMDFGCIKEEAEDLINRPVCSDKEIDPEDSEILKEEPFEHHEEEEEKIVPSRLKFPELRVVLTRLSGIEDYLQSGNIVDLIDEEEEVKMEIKDEPFESENIDFTKDKPADLRKGCSVLKDDFVTPKLDNRKEKSVIHHKSISQKCLSSQEGSTLLSTLVSKRAAPSSQATGKRQRKVMTLREKVEVLDKCKEGMSYSAVARHFGLNESTVRYMEKNEKRIRAAVAASAPHSAKVITKVRDKGMIQMEDALFLWIKDQHHKGIAIDSLIIRQKAKSLFHHFSLDKPQQTTSEGATSTPLKPFQASKGWFDKFKRRFSLKNVNLAEDSDSVDHTLANLFPPVLLNLIKEEGYKPEQVWNVDETGLYWKKLPHKTFIAKEELRSPGFKAAKDRCTLLMCGNSAGHLIQPGFIYKSSKPRAFQHRNMYQLPVYWLHNKKARLTNELFLKWFYHCFIPEVKSYLQNKGMKFKVLLILDDVQGHKSYIESAHPNVRVLFFPPNTSALIQPMEQGVVKNFKAHYSRHVIARLLAAIDNNPALDVIQYWKDFTVLDCLPVVEESLNDVKPQTVNASWKPLWPECVEDCADFSPDEAFQQTVKEIVTLAKEVPAKGFKEVTEVDILKLLDGHDKELTQEDLAELVRAANEEEEEAEADNPDEDDSGITFEKLVEISRMVEDIKRRIYNIDPSLVRALKFMRDMDEVFSPYKNLVDKMKKLAKQNLLSIFLPPRVKRLPPLSATDFPGFQTPSPATLVERPQNSDGNIVNEKSAAAKQISITKFFVPRGQQPPSHRFTFSPGYQTPSPAALVELPQNSDDDVIYEPPSLAPEGCEVELDVKLKVETSSKLGSDHSRSVSQLHHYYGQSKPCYRVFNCLAGTSRTTKTKEQFFKYFAFGMTTAQACRFHKDKLDLNLSL